MGKYYWHQMAQYFSNNMAVILLVEKTDETKNVLDVTDNH
jgi:trehalose-6-phosphate synthase